MVTFLRTLLFGFAAYGLAVWLTLEVGPQGSGRFGNADAVTRAWFVNGPLAGLVGLVLGYLFPYPRRAPPPRD